jgi:hypothetical protein
VPGEIAVHEEMVMPAATTLILSCLARMGFVGVAQLFFFLLQQQYNKKTAEAVVNQTSSPILQLRLAIAQQSARIAIAEKNLSAAAKKTISHALPVHPWRDGNRLCELPTANR